MLQMHTGDCDSSRIWFTTNVQWIFELAKKAKSFQAIITYLVELKTEGLDDLASLPKSALESLGILEASLVAESELALVRLVTDVRWSNNEWQRGVLDPFR